MYVIASGLEYVMKYSQVLVLKYSIPYLTYLLTYRDVMNFMLFEFRVGGILRKCKYFCCSSFYLIRFLETISIPF